MEQYNTPIEKLDLSSRTLNCLKRTNLNKVGQVLETDEADLIKIRNFGVKSLNELNAKLIEFGFVKEQSTTQVEEPEEEVTEDLETTPEINNITEAL